MDMLLNFNENNDIQGFAFDYFQLQEFEVQGCVTGREFIMWLKTENNVERVIQGEFPKLDPRGNYPAADVAPNIMTGTIIEKGNSTHSKIYLAYESGASCTIQHRFSIAGVEKDLIIVNAAKEFLTAVTQNDRSKIMSMLRFPLDFQRDSNNVIAIKTPEAFLAQYDDILTPDFTERLRKTFPNYLVAQPKKYGEKISLTVYGGGGIVFDPHGKVIEIYNQENSSLTPTSPPVVTVTTLQANGQLCTPSQQPIPGEMAGKILYTGSDSLLHFLDLQTRQEVAIAQTQNIFGPWISVSPDHAKVALFDQETNIVQVVSAADQSVRALQSQDIDGLFYGWLTNQKILFVEKSTSDGSVIVFDTGTGSTSEIHTNLDDVNFDPIRWYAGGELPSVIFNSALDRLIYLIMHTPETPPFPLAYILREYPSNKTLWERGTSDVGPKPTWTTNGNYVALELTEDQVDKSDVIILDKNGDELHTIEVNSGFLYELEWSPDGTQLGFLSEIDQNATELTIYDISTNKLQTYLLNQQGNSGISISKNIVWSPDSSFIVSAGYFVDTQNGCYFKFREIGLDEVALQAWLVSP